MRLISIALLVNLMIMLSLCQFSLGTVVNAPLRPRVPVYNCLDYADGKCSKCKDAYLLTVDGQCSSCNVDYRPSSI